MAAVVGNGGSTVMDGRYPEVEPYEHGMLDVGDGNLVYWEVCGNPGGKPALVLHGGPGSGCTTGLRRYFDPAAYRIVLFDQRGCGRSTPHASDPATDLDVNTTAHLLADIELLREHLGVERWLVFGGSWGSVLGLVYAEKHPERVSAMILLAVATGRQAEVDLLTRRVGSLLAEAWARFRQGVPEDERDGDLVSAYYRLLHDPVPEVRAKAARDWCDWEEAIVPTAPGPETRFEQAEYRYAFARIVTHYWSNGHFLGEDGVVLADAAHLNGIPGVIVQGCLDLGNLIGTPWQLAHAWRSSELILVDDAGHDSSTPGMVQAVIDATDRFAG